MKSMFIFFSMLGQKEYTFDVPIDLVKTVVECGQNILQVYGSELNNLSFDPSNLNDEQFNERSGTESSVEDEEGE